MGLLVTTAADVISALYTRHSALREVDVDSQNYRPKLSPMKTITSDSASSNLTHIPFRA